MRCALVLFNNAAFVGIFRMQVSGAPGSTVVPSHGFASKPGRNLRIQISRRWTADVGIASAISKPGACARRHVEAIRLRLFAVITAGDKPLLLIEPPGPCPPSCWLMPRSPPAFACAL